MIARLFICICAATVLPAEAPLKEFYIISMMVSDNGPSWYHYILDVKLEDRDSIVRYVRIAPMDLMCLDSITVQAATARLSGISPSDLLARTNPCTIDTSSLNRELRRRTHAHAMQLRHVPVLIAAEPDRRHAPVAQPSFFVRALDAQLHRPQRPGRMRGTRIGRLWQQFELRNVSGLLAM